MEHREVDCNSLAIVSTCSTRLAKFPQKFQMCPVSLRVLFWNVWSEIIPSLCANFCNNFRGKFREKYFQVSFKFLWKKQNSVAAFTIGCRKLFWCRVGSRKRRLWIRTVGTLSQNVGSIIFRCFPSRKVRTMLTGNEIKMQKHDSNYVMGGKMYFWSVCAMAWKTQWTISIRFSLKIQELYLYLQDSKFKHT